MNIFMIAGETSGDRLGGSLLQELKKHYPHLKAEGIGGENMIREGLHSLLPIEQFQVMGFTQILLSLPKLWRQGHMLKKRILKTNPDAVILIDYPGFNLRLAHMLRHSGYKGKLIQYGCPTFWAWGKNRKQTLIENYDLLLTLFPFEADFFAATSLKATFVGHPLLKEISGYHEDISWQQSLKKQGEVIALFPGSRRWEVEYNLPLQLAAARQLQKKHPNTTIAVSTLHPVDLPVGVVAVDPTHNYDLMRCARAALAKSGTITLELALHGVPTIVTYASSKINRWIAGYVLRIRLPNYCMVNILAGKRVFPEFIEHIPSADELAETLHQHMEEGPVRENCLAGCKQVLHSMGHRNGNEVAAEAIKELLCGEKLN